MLSPGEHSSQPKKGELWLSTKPGDSMAESLPASPHFRVDAYSKDLYFTVEEEAFASTDHRLLTFMATSGPATYNAVEES
ncbi:hypothetical protein TREES_T100000169 [Tupaia chinensis]|uniref:Uncharacterized protein n=1 Tax=Tupaia chinensis TaxID=246437 RepID=L9L885_TUPCH|nr:hypothetical protein TREES_T100000169 [Tupaia chinensis]